MSSRSFWDAGDSLVDTKMLGDIGGGFGAKVFSGTGVEVLASAIGREVFGDSKIRPVGPWL